MLSTEEVLRRFLRSQLSGFPGIYSNACDKTLARLENDDGDGPLASSLKSSIMSSLIPKSAAHSLYASISALRSVLMWCSMISNA